MSNVDFQRYVIMLNKIEGIDDTEDLIRAHVSYLKDLDNQMRLVLCGPFSDFAGGMVIVKADSLEHAEELANKDPFVIQNKRSYSIKTLELSCEENNHLGMG